MTERDNLLNPTPFCHTFQEWQLLSFARDVQKESGKRLVGPTFLNDELTSISFNARQKLMGSLAGESLEKRGLTKDVLFDISQKFEEMCRRRDINLESFNCTLETRAKIYGLIAHRVLQTAEHLDLSPHKVVGACTLSETNPAFLIFNDNYQSFISSLTTFRTAASKYCYPNDYLDAVSKTLVKLMQLDEFSDFRETPGILLLAASRHTSEPESFLRAIQKAVREISHNEEFKYFAQSKSILLRVASTYPKNTESNLRQIVATANSLRSDPRFSDLHEHPSVFLLAALNHKIPEAYLLKSIDLITQLRSDPTYQNFMNTPGIFRHAAIRYENPELFILEKTVELIELQSIPEFRPFHRYPSLFTKALINHPQNPKQYLTRLLEASRRPDCLELKREREFLAKYYPTLFSELRDSAK
jgi:hypothetical protein